MRSNKAFTIACLIALGIIFWVASEAGGATYKKRLRFVGDYDSVQVVWAQKIAGTDTSIFTDSFWVTSIPNDTLATIDDNYDWEFWYIYWSGGEGASSGAFTKYTAGPATISSDQLREGAHYVEETLKVHHGSDSWLTGTGTGSNAVRYYAVDTSGTDQAIIDVQVTMRTIADVFDAGVKTNANGYSDFTAPTDSMITLGRRAGYYFFYDTNNITGSLTDTLYGYNVPLQASPDPNLCRVQGYVFVPGGKPTRKITVTATVGGGVYNYCDSTAFIAEPVITYTSIHADSLGFFFMDLVPSGCLLENDGDSLQYTLKADLRGSESKSKLIWVPQLTEYEVVW